MPVVRLAVILPITALSAAEPVFFSGSGAFSLPLQRVPALSACLSGCLTSTLALFAELLCAALLTLPISCLLQAQFVCFHIAFESCYLCLLGRHWGLGLDGVGGDF